MPMVMGITAAVVLLLVLSFISIPFFVIGAYTLLVRRLGSRDIN